MWDIILIGHLISDDGYSNLFSMQTIFLSLKLFLWWNYGQRYVGMIEILETEGLFFKPWYFKIDSVCGRMDLDKKWTIFEKAIWFWKEKVELKGKRTHSWHHVVKWLVKTHCSHSLCHTMRTRVWQLGGICSSLQWQEAQSLSSVLYDWSSADTSYDMTWDCSIWVTQYISFYFKTFFMNGYFACMYVLLYHICAWCPHGSEKSSTAPEMDIDRYKPPYGC